MTETRQNKLTATLTLLRPVQWVKNGFVFAPLVFSRQYMDGHDDFQALKAFVGFCLISSAVYIYNDLNDRIEDSRHPIKRYRPLASGMVAPGNAILLALVLTAASLGLSFWVNQAFVGVTIAYALLSAAYTNLLKRIAILDVMTISAGFLLRILAGSVAVGAKPSHWILLCTIMISLFLGFAKRRAELIAAEPTIPSTRHVLKDYSIKFLDQVIAIVTGATIICYALYTVDARTCSADVLGTRMMILTVPCVIYGIFRYLYIMYHMKQGEDPTQTLIRDWPSLLNLAIWALLSIFVVSCGCSLDHYLIENLFSH